MRLSDLVKGLGLAIHGNDSVKVTHITHDSRKVEPGSLFVALVGENRDGHDYIGRAAQLGAVAVLSRYPQRVMAGLPCIASDHPRRAMAWLARRLYDAPDSKLKVIGITGTNGKTTTCFLTGQLLATKGLCGRMGTLSYFNGMTEERAHRTTPESSEVYATLREMVENRCAYAAVEISSHAMMFERVSGMQLHYGVFTNLSRDHLDFHGDMEAYFSAKQLMFDMLPVGSTAIVNGDDAYGRRVTVKDGVRLLRIGSSEDCEMRFDEVALNARETSFAVCIGTERHRVTLPLLGLHNVYNFMCAAAVARCEGLGWQELTRVAATVKAVAGRMETVREGQDFQVVVDFAHSPDALEKVVSCCKDLCEGKLILVFGAGGDRDKDKRQLMGAVAHQHADAIVVTSDNPRSEDPQQIIEMVGLGIPRPLGPTYMQVADRYEAIELALGRAQSADMVLIAGKGHETHQEVAGKFLPFNDREVAVRILRNMEARRV